LQCRKLSESVTVDGITRDMSYTYDRWGDKLTYTSPEGVEHSYSYDKLGQPLSMSVGGNTITYEYDWNRLVSQSLPNGLTVQHTYNGNGWLTRTVVPRVDIASGVLLTDTYAHDEVGNITLKDTEIGQYAYTYDEASRLIGADIPGDGPMSYGYDLSGNMTEGPLGHLNFNANNEPTVGDTFTYEHDSNGNLISKTSSSGETTVYHYDGASRLVRVELPDGTLVEYLYDPFNRRVKKTVTSPDGAAEGEATYYAYSDEGLVAEYDETGAQKKSYQWRPGTPWGTDPVSMEEDGQYYYYHNDNLGTPQSMTDADGNMVWQATYDAYGDATVDEDADGDGNTITSNLRFPGQYHDAETGLHYNWSRHYEPKAARYTQKDILGVFSGDYNLFRYSFNNPLAYYDNNGESAIAVGICAALIVFDYYAIGKDLLDAINEQIELIKERDCNDAQIEDEYDKGIPDADKMEDLYDKQKEIQKKMLNNAGKLAKKRAIAMAIGIPTGVFCAAAPFIPTL